MVLCRASVLIFCVYHLMMKDRLQNGDGCLQDNSWQLDHGSGSQLMMTVSTSFEDPYYSWSMLRSFREVNNHSDVVVFVPEAQMESDNLKKISSLVRMKVVSYKPAGLIVNQRFHLWLEYLGSHDNEYDVVITSDSKDIYFQRDPFQGCEIFRQSDRCRISVVREDQRYIPKTFYPDRVDLNVVKCLGMEEAEKVQNLNLLNAGFLAGSTDGLKLLFTRLSSELNERGDRCLDQVLLNQLVWNRTFENTCHVRIEPDSQRCLVNLGITYNHYSETKWLWGLGDETFTVKGVYGDVIPAAVVHMYDRDAGHRAYVQNRWPWPYA